MVPFAGGAPKKRIPSFVRLLGALIAWRMVLGPLWDLLWAQVVRLVAGLAARVDRRLRIGHRMNPSRWTGTPRVTATPAIAADGAMRRYTSDEPALSSREAGVPLELQAEISSIRAHLQGARPDARHSIHFEIGPLVKFETKEAEGATECGWHESFRVSLSASAAALRGWSLAVSCIEHVPGGARLIGRVSISLWACATGPRLHDHELRSPADGHAPIGRVAFRLVFAEHRAWQVRLERVRFSMPLDSIALEKLLGAGQEPGTAGTSWLRAHRQLALDHRQRSTRLTYRLSQKQLVADTLFVSPVAHDLRLELASGEGGGSAAGATSAREQTGRGEHGGEPHGKAAAAASAALMPSAAAASAAYSHQPSACATPTEGNRTPDVPSRSRTGSVAAASPPDGHRRTSTPAHAAAPLGTQGVDAALLSQQPNGTVDASLSAPHVQASFAGPASSAALSFNAATATATAASIAAAATSEAAATSAIGRHAVSAPEARPPTGSLAHSGSGAAALAAALAQQSSLDATDESAWRVVAEWEGRDLPPISSYGYFEDLLYGTARLQLTSDADELTPRQAKHGGGRLYGGGADAPPPPPTHAEQLTAGALSTDAMSLEQRFKTGRQSALCWLRMEQLFARAAAEPPLTQVGRRAHVDAAALPSSAASSDHGFGGGLGGGLAGGPGGGGESREGSEAGGDGGSGTSASEPADAALAEPRVGLVATFDEYLWVKGVRAGRVSGVARFEQPPFFSQLLTGTLSEGGVVRQVCTVIMPPRAAPVAASAGRGPSGAFSSFLSSLVSTGADADRAFGGSSEPRELLLLTERLLAQISAGTVGGAADGQLSATFDAVDRLLLASHKESLRSFVYTSTGALHDCQAVLVSFGLRLLDSVGLVRYALRARCYQTLVLLLRRGELNQLVLDQLGPGGDGLPHEILRLLITLLFRLLATALNGLHHGDMLEEQPSFHATVIAVCYFRLPRFADPLLEALAEPASADRESAPPTAAGTLDGASGAGVEIPEWRGLVFDLENDARGALPPSEALRNHSEASLEAAGRARQPAARHAAASSSHNLNLDWSPLHSAADDAMSAPELAVLRAMVPPVAAWRSRLRAAGTPLFCSIFEQWVLEVKSCAPDMDEAQWHTIPGYKLLVRRFLLELKAQHVMHYPEALLRLATTLLQHTHLHSVVTRIVLLKTSLHDVGGVSAALDLVGVWVGTLKLVNMPMIRSAFDFEFLFDAIRELLAGEQMQVLLKTIEFLYTGFDLLLEEQADVLRRVVRPFFLKLFCHWSPNVRRFFHHLLIFRLIRPIGWTHVVKQLPTARLLPADAVEHAPAGSASARGSPAVARDRAAAGVQLVQADDGARSEQPADCLSPPTLRRHTSPGVGPRTGAITGSVSLPRSASATHEGASLGANGGGGGEGGNGGAGAGGDAPGEQLGRRPGSFDSDGGDVVSWYEGALDDLRNGRLSRVPRDLRVYVPQSVRSLDALAEQYAGVLRTAVSSGEPLIIPALHWDTLLLDNETY